MLSEGHKMLIINFLLSKTMVKSKHGIKREVVFL